MTVNGIKWQLITNNVWRAIIEVSKIGCVDLYVPKSQIRKVENLMKNCGNHAIRYSVRELHNPLKFKKYHYAFTRGY